MVEAAQILTEELDREIIYEPLPASDLRKLPIGQTIEMAYFECIVWQMELLQSGQLPDFADIYNNIPQITGQSPTSFRKFIQQNLAEFK